MKPPRLNDSSNWDYDGEPTEISIENVGLHLYNIIVDHFGASLKTDSYGNKILNGRIAFFACYFSNCPNGKTSECYANHKEKFRLFGIHADPVAKYNWPDPPPREKLYRHVDGLFSLMLSMRRHFCFNNDPATSGYNNEVKSIFKDIFMANEQTAPKVSEWDDALKMRHIFGHTCIQNGRRMIFAIESMVPPMTAKMPTNEWDKIILDVCEKATSRPCEKCLNGECGERMGCMRLFPRIREVFADFCNLREDLAEDFLLPLFKSNYPCPLCP